MAQETSNASPRRGFVVRRALAAVGLACLLVGIAVAADPPSSPSPSQPTPNADDQSSEVILTFKDGRRLTGPLVEQTSEAITIKIAGIPAKFSTEEIDRIEVLEPLMVRYMKLREAVGNDPDQIVRVAEWLQGREKYELALAEVNRALARDSKHPDAMRLKVQLEQQILLKAKAGAPKQPAKPAEDAPDARRANVQNTFPLLTTNEINLIKVFETEFSEEPRVIIPRETIAAMLDKYSDHPLVPITKEGREAIYRKTPLEQLDLMFRIQAREFYSQVQVLDQPKAFSALRDQIGRTWLLQSCATNQCHGGMEAGRLVLHNRRPNSEQTVYTNFLILDRFRLEDGSPLIDWQSPERSPLLQLGLPKDKSRRPHPVAPHGETGKDTFKPTFRSMEDERFKAAVTWIKSLHQPRSEYPIEYRPVRPLSPVPKAVSPPAGIDPSRQTPGSTPDSGTNPGMKPPVQR
jgi:hypothetical protein